MVAEREEHEVPGTGEQGADAPGVSARLWTTDGWPLADAVLTVTDTAGKQVARVHSGEDGAIGTTALGPGTYTAIVTAIGYQPHARTAVVHGSRGADLGDLRLERSGGQELPATGLWRIDPVHSSIRATAQHLGISSIHGRFNDFTGTVRVADPVESSEVDVQIRAESIDTANADRDAHLRAPDFLDVTDHPEITYAARKLVPRGPNEWDLAGDLTLCGVTRPVTLDTRFLGVGVDPWGGTRASARATAQLRREDFAMTFNQALRTGIAAIGTTLQVEVDIQAVPAD